MNLQSPLVSDLADVDAPDRPSKRVSIPTRTLSAEMPIDLADRPVKELAHIKHPAREAGGDEQTVRLNNEIPTLFGRYRLLKILGKGGMGSVYLAEDTQLGRTVALKIPHLATDTSQVTARFQREARAAATVTHPNICTLYDVGENNGVPFLIMAYIEGTPLSVVMETNPQLEVSGIISLVRKIALAMQEAHQHGVIHRDLKPANVLIDKRGEPVIMDFGIAWLRRMHGGFLTLPGTAWGTPSYMAPEVVTGKAEVGCPSCDIYALGVIFYELLTGQSPFSGEPSAVLYQIEFGTPSPPSAHRPALCPKLEAICLKAMAKNVADRYASMAELATALANLSEYPIATDTKMVIRGHRDRDSDKTQKVIQQNRPKTIPDRGKHQRRSRHRSRLVWGVVLAGLSLMLLLTVWSLFDSSSGHGTMQIKWSDNEAEREVSIDGVRLSAEESGKPQHLEAGAHWLSVTGKDCEPVNLSFRVEKGQNSIVYVELPVRAVKPIGEIVATPKEKPPLAIPQLLAPKDRAELDVFPRETNLNWSPVPGASQYRIEVQFTLPFPGAEWADLPQAFPTENCRETSDTTYRIHFVGAQPGRWRVWAVDEFGHEGPKSSWWHFVYTR